MRALSRAVAYLLCLSLVAAAAGASAVPAVATAGATTQERPNPCVGTMEKRAGSSTLVTMQGIKFTGDGFKKTPSLLISFGPEGRFEWAHNATANGRWWAYDVDKLPNGNLLFATTEPGISVAEEIDPQKDGHVWVKRFDKDNGDAPGFHPQNVTDAHDVDLINGDELLIADKGDHHHRLLIYNMTREEVTWEWFFRNHTDAFPKSGGGDYDKDWTHVNDVDKVGPGKYMASVRNFDQVVVVDRETKDITTTLGADDDHRFMNEQHNPQYLTTEAGNPSILIADSLNDRVVEWTRRGGEWVKTWELVGGGLDEPRDADRLPNGNTLVVDRKGHRTMEVTPGGKVVWEVYTPYQPYDAERYGLRDEQGGPAAPDLNASTTVELHNSAAFDRAQVESCAQAMFEFAPSRTEQLIGGLTGSANQGAPSANNSTAEPSSPSAGPTSAGVGPFALGGAVVVLVALVAFYLLRD